MSSPIDFTNVRHPTNSDIINQCTSNIPYDDEDSSALIDSLNVQVGFKADQNVKVDHYKVDSSSNEESEY